VEAVPGVAEVNLVPGEQVVKIALHQSAYLSEIVPLVQKSLAAFGGQFTLELMDEPTAEQRDALRRMMFVVEEAILQGSFQDMEALLQEMAQEYGQELTLAVDRSYVYIQLRDGEGHLNRVIGRGGTELGVSS
jgi:predicted RNA-binding protein Jag